MHHSGTEPLVSTTDEERFLCLGRVPCPAEPPPARPGAALEWLGRRLLLALSPGLPPAETKAPPETWAPFERVSIPRSSDPGTLAAWYFPADVAVDGEAARGAVLLCHPWLPYGQSYFFRRLRITALRAAGYDVMTFDFGGFGASGPRPSGFYDRDVDDALAELARRAPGLPLHVWGVSAGGYWTHMSLSRRAEPVHGAVFEHVTDHLIEWSKRTAPAGMPFYLFYQHVLTPAYRYLDLNAHAAHLNCRAVTYIGGDRDPGVPLDCLHRLAGLAGASRHVVPGAGHLEAMRRDGRRVVELALETFRKAEAP